jgi:hypothetical protein
VSTGFRNVLSLLDLFDDPKFSSILQSEPALSLCHNCLHAICHSGGRRPLLLDQSEHESYCNFEPVPLLCANDISTVSRTALRVPDISGTGLSMRALVVLLIAALPLVLSVLAHPRRHSTRSVGLAIPISRRNKVRSVDGVVNAPRLKASTQRSIR